MKKRTPGMLLGFKKQFEPMIRNGSKRHTLRGESKVTRVVGGICHNYTGLRTKKCKLIGRWRCTRIERVEIGIVASPVDPDGRFTIVIEGEELTPIDRCVFAYADGFRKGKRGDVAAMRAFWVKENKLKSGSWWTGVLIHWDFGHPVTKDGRPVRRRKRAK